MASALATHDYKQTREELARAIRILRSDCSPHELARLRLDYEANYDWTCFVPNRGQETAGALTKYFGR